MNDIVFQQPGGFPLENNTLNAMQQNYKSLQALGELAGNKTIIKGCNQLGNSVSDGYIYYNGELLKFKGGVKQSYIIIVENSIPGEFEDGSIKDIYKNRWAQFGSDSNQILWSEFKRPGPLLEFVKKLANLEERITKIVPIGLVAVWDRPADEIPEGWVEHVEMKGRTPVHQDTSIADFASLGTNLGQKQVILKKENLPTFSLDYYMRTDRNNDLRYCYPNSKGITNYVNGTSLINYGKRGGYGLVLSGGSQDEPMVKFETSRIGENEKVNNIQPSRIVRFIRFVGFN